MKAWGEGFNQYFDKKLTEKENHWFYHFPYVEQRTLYTNTHLKDEVCPLHQQGNWGMLRLKKLHNIVQITYSTESNERCRDWLPTLWFHPGNVLPPLDSYCKPTLHLKEKSWNFHSFLCKMTPQQWTTLKHITST